MPVTFEEVKDEPKFWPRWADHRIFMDRTFTEIHALGREAIRQVDPGARVGFDGVFTLDSWHGYDFYQLSKSCDLVQVYATRPHQIEYLRSWHSQDSIRGAWYNHIGNTNETSAKWLGWHLLLHDMNSSWYWTSFNTGPALLFPDLRPTSQFLWMQESLAEIKAGIGRLLSPDGSCRRCDTQNVLTSQNKTVVSIPLALNAPAGDWKLRVTDVATGKTATAKFRVDPR